MAQEYHHIAVSWLNRDPAHLTTTTSLGFFILDIYLVNWVLKYFLDNNTNNNGIPLEEYHQFAAMTNVPQ